MSAYYVDMIGYWALVLSMGTVSMSVLMVLKSGLDERSRRKRVRMTPYKYTQKR